MKSKNRVFYIILFLCLNPLSCVSNKVKSEKIVKVQLSAISSYIQTSTPMTEERLMKLESKPIFKYEISNKKVLKNIQKRLIKLEYTEFGGIAVWLSVLLYFENQKPVYLSFSGYQNLNYIRYNNKSYKWDQELANIFYPFIPERIIESLPDEVK